MKNKVTYEFEDVNGEHFGASFVPGTAPKPGVWVSLGGRQCRRVLTAPMISVSGANFKGGVQYGLLPRTPGAKEYDKQGYPIARSMAEVREIERATEGRCVFGQQDEGTVKNSKTLADALREKPEKPTVDSRELFNHYFRNTKKAK